MHLTASSEAIPTPTLSQVSHKHLDRRVDEAREEVEVVWSMQGQKLALRGEPIINGGSLERVSVTDRIPTGSMP